MKDRRVAVGFERYEFDEDESEYTVDTVVFRFRDDPIVPSSWAEISPKVYFPNGKCHGHMTVSWPESDDDDVPTTIEMPVGVLEEIVEFWKEYADEFAHSAALD